MKNKDQILLEGLYGQIYENAMSEVQQGALDKLPPHLKDIANQLLSYLSKGARKASFYYRSKLSGREGKYFVDLGVDYGSAKRESHDAIQKYVEMLRESDPENPDIEVGEKILNPPPSNRKPSVDRKINLGHGISIQDTVKEPGVYRLYIYAYMQNDIEKDDEGKAVRDFEGGFVRSAAGKVDEVVPASKPKSFSSAEQLQYKLKTKLSRFRRFILDPENISGVTYKNGVMEFQKDTQEITANESFKAKNILTEERNVPPEGWDKGFEFPMKVGSGGKEIPFKKNGKWYLYVWDSKNNKHFYYCYDDDIYHPDTEFGNL
jgi:hypothetical protein